MKQKILSVLPLLVCALFSSTLSGQKLSKATKSTFGKINGQITVKVYMSENLPDTLNRTRSVLEDILNEYQKESDDKIAFTFINPDKATKREYFFFQENFTQFQVVEESNELYRYRNVYTGAIMFYGSNFVVIPEITPSTSIEYTITRNIKRLLSNEQSKIGIIFGHGEPTFSSFKAVVGNLTDLYKFEPVDLEMKPDLSKHEALLLVSPRELIDERHFEQLDAYLNAGGDMFVAVDRVNVDTRTKQGVSLITGIGQWLGEYGIMVKKEFVVDQNCGLVIINQGAFKMPISLPYLPSVEKFENHPVTNDLGRIVFRYPSPVECTKKEFNSQPIIKTSFLSKTFKSPLLIDYNKIWDKNEFSDGSIPIATAVEAKMDNGKTARLVVISDGDFLLDDKRDYSEDGDNLKIMFNTIEWLTDKSGLIDLKMVKEVK